MAQLEVTNLNAVLSVLQRRCKFILQRSSIARGRDIIFLRDADGWRIRDSD